MYACVHNTFVDETEVSAELGSRVVRYSVCVRAADKRGEREREKEETQQYGERPVGCRRTGCAVRKCRPATAAGTRIFIRDEAR